MKKYNIQVELNNHKLIAPILAALLRDDPYFVSYFVTEFRDELDAEIESGTSEDEAVKRALFHVHCLTRTGGDNGPDDCDAVPIVAPMRRKGGAK